jgi:Rha family phage regulatory protein
MSERISTNLFGDELPRTPLPVKASIVLREVNAANLGLRIIAAKSNRDRIVSDSRKFAKVFGKDHRNVTRDIEMIQQKICSNLSTSSWFQSAAYLDSYGREQRCFDLTRDGALTLGMSYDPVIAAMVLIAFNKLEDTLAQDASVLVDPMLNRVEARFGELEFRVDRTIQTAITAAFKSAFNRIYETFDRLLEGVEWIEAALDRRRVSVSPEDERIALGVVATFYKGDCPCCQQRHLLDANGETIRKSNGNPVCEFDHYSQSRVADLQHVWPVCSGEKGDKTSCHYRLTHGSTAREFRLDSVHVWAAFQCRVIEYLNRRQQTLPL